MTSLIQNIGNIGNFENNELTKAIEQGEQFKKYQKRINRNIRAGKEGFDAVPSFDTNPTYNAEKSKDVLERNKLKASDVATLNSLKTQYASLQDQIQTLQNKNMGSVQTYLDITDPNNKYHNTNARLTDAQGAWGYVTNKGNYKYYASMDIVNNTAGKNGCPAPGQTIDIPNSGLSWSGSNVPYTEGHILTSTPHLVTGTMMQKGQSCGNEGSNVYVDSVLPSSATASYKGCYTDDPVKPTMTFLGASPPPQSAIVNGNFSQPSIGNNSYTVGNIPGWVGNGCLCNNSAAWGYPMPYPAGNQCMSLQGHTAYMSQVLKLDVGNYVISFFACGRPCCDRSGQSNPIAVKLNETIIYACNPTMNAWTRFSTPLNVTKNGNNTLTFAGTYDGGDRSSAIQNVSITGSATAAGTYTYDKCQQAAKDGGYQYFALQDVNTQTSKGYCAVSNDSIAPTKGGTAYVVSNAIALWNSVTYGKTGCSAILSLQGSLSVVQNGTSIFSTPNTTKTGNAPPNFLGCYGDSGNRAMSLVNGGSQSYDIQSCSDLATAQGAKYFGLQNSSSGKGAQCALSSDWQSTTKYGKASNCTKLASGINVGSSSGGGWSNAVYSLDAPATNYFLILQDDGNMVIYKGTGPNDNQGVVWATGTQTKQQKPDPRYTAAKGKYGKNYITTSQTLAANDFIGSNDGSIYLIMQTDGNLVLYTSQTAENCLTMQDGKKGGGQGANAFYDLGMAGFPNIVGKMGYVNNDGVLSEYPASMLKKNSTYTKYANINYPGNDAPTANRMNKTAAECQAICEQNDMCGGFVYDNNNKVCYPKNMITNYETNNYSAGGTDTYLRQPAAPNVKSGPGSNKPTANVDSVKWSNYINSKKPVSIAIFDQIGSLTSTEQQQIDQLKGQLNLIAQKISDKTNIIIGNTANIDSQVESNNANFDTSARNFDAITKFDQSKQLFNINNIVSDSDIVVLQENYKYLLWSILAITIVAVSLKVLKK